MDVRVLFIESNQVGGVTWFTCVANDLPVAFAKLNGSEGFRKNYPGVMTHIQGDINKWQCQCVFDSVHFLVAIGKE